VLDLSGTEAELGKPVGNDLREGTVTLPLIWAAQDSPATIRELVAAIRAGNDVGDLVEAVRRSGALERCLALAELHSGKAVVSLDAFPAGSARTALADLAVGLVARRR